MEQVKIVLLYSLVIYCHIKKASNFLISSKGNTFQEM